MHVLKVYLNPLDGWRETHYATARVLHAGLAGEILRLLDDKQSFRVTAYASVGVVVVKDAFGTVLVHAESKHV